MARMYIFQLLAAIAAGFIAARKGRSIFFWSFACMVLPLLTLVLLALPSRKTGAGGAVCPQCSERLRGSPDRCSRCGWQKAIELVRCSRCGSYVSDREQCPVCSRKGEENGQRM